MELFLDEAFKQGIVPAIVVAVYLIITKILDNHKEKTQIKLSEDLTKSINLISNFIVNITKNIIEKDKDKCKNAIEDAISGSEMRLIQFLSNTVVNNNIQKNKNNIMINIHNIVNSEYYVVFSTLSMYSVNDIKVSEFFKKSWIEEVKQDMITVLYDTSLSKENKIVTFSNKINIRFKSYISYIINNTLKR